MTTTVGSYLATRFSQVGIENHFVVAGDYNLSLLDKLQEHPELEEVNCCNELNCSFAAEGYARSKGVAAVVVTFNVGAFSAFNGIGSSYAENLPVILVVGSPNTNESIDHNLIHHTIGTHNLDYEFEMAKKITCAAVQIKHAQDAPRLIDYAIRKCLTRKKPCYIEIPTNMATQACPAPGPLEGLLYQLPSEPNTLSKAVDAAAKLIESRSKPTMLAGSRLKSAGAEESFLTLAETLGCAVAVMPAAKSLFPEDHPQYVGVYWGNVSTKKADAILQWSDLTICAGCVFTDYSTAGWTSPQPAAHRLEADSDEVKFSGHYYGHIKLADFLDALTKKVKKNDKSLIEYRRLRPPPPLVEAADPSAPLTRQEMTRQIQGLFNSNTTFFAETGDSWFNGIQMDLPRGAKFEAEMQWGHIGWSIPACFGYSVGAPDRQIVTMVGDGSFQVTVQEVAQMVRLKKPILIFLINNYGYTIEVEIHDGPYNDIKNWNYAALIEAFNADDGHGKGYQVKTGAELAEAIEKSKTNNKGPTLIEIQIHRDDCTTELVTWGQYVALANDRPPIS
ncbi:hypothetical protein HG536_0F00140 [Torulaspora globosa]|uniref:pyruvate decarboxylase n=1 Tax=Torulaspora globosa TaxID=48254 RepID=A0A7G3ZJK4_9SACH|nr:uncharacterized protein HG536_0F00140 [Torulaspora globosa]QLL33690.1 hypothetical protein HG536_0F00140 [Torulaspora globosa]